MLYHHHHHFQNFQYVPLCWNVSCIWWCNVFVWLLYNVVNVLLCIVCHLSLFWCNMNLYFGLAALNYRINHILSYLITRVTYLFARISHSLEILLKLQRSKTSAHESMCYTANYKTTKNKNIYKIAISDFCILKLWISVLNICVDMLKYI